MSVRLKNGQDYRESLRKLKRPIFAMGRRIEDVTEDPLTRHHVASAAMTFEMAHMPNYRDLFTAPSHLSGETINRFTHIHQSADDLVRKVKMLRACGQMTGTCFQRCVGFDAMNALYSTTYEMDEKHGTEYHARFLKYLRYVQDNDLMPDGAMTDPKGDRSLPPSQQPDPDQYVHVVERTQDGIVVRGAKQHQTGAVNSHEIIVMPTATMREADKDYAVSFAVPADAEGLLYIFGRQTNDSRRLEAGDLDLGNAEFGIVGGEALVVFDDVFVPWGRVFMCGEHDFTGMLVERFACYHRQNYGACKVGLSDILIGATAEISEIQGTAKASHVRDKIAEMIHLSESLYAGSIGCSAEGTCTASGAYYPDTMLANTVKLNVTRNIYEIARLAHDLVGGVIATMPAESDLHDPEVGKWVQKYFGGAAGVPAEHRMRVARLIENMTGGTALVESMHGAGSPQAMKVMILRQANLEHKRRMAKRVAGVFKSEKERKEQ